jgi:hypothetical protein
MTILSSAMQRGLFVLAQITVDKSIIGNQYLTDNYLSFLDLIAKNSW